MGNVTFYYAVDDANNDGNTSGDKIYTGTTNVLAQSTGIAEVSNTIKCGIYPNPAAEGINVSFDATGNELATIQLYSCDGKLVHSQVVRDIVSGRNNLPVEFPTTMAPGIYTAVVANGSQQFSNRFVVK